MRGGRLVLESDYFGRGRPEFGRGWTHFEGGEGAQETSAEFSWPLGDVVTELVRAGLRIDSLEEFPAGNDDSYRFGAASVELNRLPASFLLVAHKPSNA
jgi:hypothetical protein